MADSKGTFICYKWKQFTKAHEIIIGQVNFIIDEMTAEGYPSMSVRRIHYEGVTKNWWENTPSQYGRLIDVISAGRLAGLISWTAIEDEGRNLMGINTVDSPAQLVKQAMNEFALDLWHNQEWRPEVWVEKAGQQGVVGRICNQLRVDFFATRGYCSDSEMWKAGRRFARRIRKGQRPIVFHLGDHDPSGLDMTRDIREKLAMFAGVPVTVVRIGLNMDQIEELKPPANFLKVGVDGKFTDSRAEAYYREFGEESWELEVLRPAYVHNIIEQNVMRIRDEELWDEALEEETQDKRRLEELLKQFGGTPEEQDDDQD